MSHVSALTIPKPKHLCLSPPAPISSYSGSPFPASVQDLGLHIWRVEKLKPVPLARENHGIFFSGDSYLVLHNGPEEVSHLHLWIGNGVGIRPRQGRRLQGVSGTLPITSHLHPRPAVIPG